MVSNISPFSFQWMSDHSFTYNTHLNTDIAVRGCKGVRNISRETFAVFMEPEYHTPMNLPVGRTLEDTQCIESEKYLPSNTRTLRSRWKLGMNFGEFSNATFAAFH
jgi:hypothetical protein